MAEVPDFWTTFTIDDEVPERVRKFLHRSRAGSTMGQTTGYYAHGYGYAFERLIMIAIEMWPQADYLRMPVFFLARHSTELHLKEVIQDYSARNRLPYKFSNEQAHHPLE
jgi:hypothetical protein